VLSPDADEATERAKQVEPGLTPTVSSLRRGTPRVRTEGIGEAAPL
jgi:hypothetical protein